jgi:hypothetical protein
MDVYRGDIVQSTTGHVGQNVIFFIQRRPMQSQPSLTVCWKPYRSNVPCNAPLSNGRCSTTLAFNRVCVTA